MAASGYIIGKTGLGEDIREYTCAMCKCTYRTHLGSAYSQCGTEHGPFLSICTSCRVKEACGEKRAQMKGAA